MPDRKHPGVYIEEVPSSVKPIEGASTSTAGFIGWAPKGDLDKANLVTSFSEFEEKYGSFYVNEDGSILSYLAHSVFQFFNNGGTRCYIARVANGAAVADIILKDRKASSEDTLKISALTAGAWGNMLDIEIADGTDDSSNEFNLIVKPMKKVNGGEEVIEAEKETHKNLSMSPAAPNFVEKVLTMNSELIRAQCVENSSVVAGFSQGAVVDPSISLPAENRKMLININGDGFQEIELADPVTDGGEIATAITTAVGNLTKLRNSTKDEAFDDFACEFNITDPLNPYFVLTSGTQGIDPDTGVASSVVIKDAAPENNAAELLNLGLTNQGTEVKGSAILRPANGTFYVGSAGFTEGSDGTTPQNADYIGGFNLFNTIRDVSILAVPGIGDKDIVNFGGTYCEGRSALTGVNDCFFVGDMNVTDDTVDEAQTYVTSLTKKSPYTAVYFPWLKMVDPTGIRPVPISVPPSGFIVGMCAKIDGTRGVWKAPAGTEANIGGASGLLKNVTDQEQDSLNDKGANCIRMFPAAGLVVWGARTLSTSSQPEWRYVPVRRTAIFLEVSLYNGIQWAVFEPNDEDLWSSLRLNIGAFMMRLFRQGAFQGSTPSEAFFVKCDSKTTTQADIDAGVVNILVGFAPLKPAEFVVLKLSQKAGQAS
jgi:phage tail sheath protein FI